MRQAIAALERLVPRGVTAVTSIVVAAVTDPEAFGFYTWAVIVLTLFLALSDQPARQVAVPALSSERGERFLRRYMRLASFAGIGAMAIAIAAIGLAANDGAIAIALLPLALSPAAVAMSTMAVASLQLNEQWGRLSLARLIGALAGVSIGVSVALLTRSVLGAALSVLISEAVFTLVVLKRASLSSATLNPSVQNVDPTTDHAEPPTARAFAHMQVYSGLAWLQGQLDRVLLGAWAGPAVLGLYSLATAIGRSGGDALAASQANLLRAELSRSRPSNPSDIAKSADRVLLPGVFLASAVVALTALISKFVLAPILGAEWAEATMIAPILALTAFPALLSWSSAPLHLHRRRAGRANIAPVIGLAFAPVVAVVAVSSLMTAAWIVVAREFLLALAQMLILGRSAPLRSAALALASLACGAVAVVLLGSWR